MTLKKIFKNKVLSPLLAFLKQGMSPHKLSLTLALGLIFGVMPFLGISTSLLVLIAIILKLNIPAIQLVNYAAYVIQITLFVPFLKSGQFIFNGPELPFELSNVIGMLQTQFWGTLEAIWEINLLGVATWAIIAIPGGFGIYHFSRSFFTKQQQKLQLELV